MISKLLNFYTRLELMVNRPREELNKFFSSMCEDNFAFELISELAKAFLRAEDRTAQVSN